MRCPYEEEGVCPLSAPELSVLAEKIDRLAVQLEQDRAARQQERIEDREFRARERQEDRERDAEYRTTMDRRVGKIEALITDPDGIAAQVRDNTHANARQAKLGSLITAALAMPIGALVINWLMN